MELKESEQWTNLSGQKTWLQMNDSVASELRINKEVYCINLEALMSSWTASQKFPKILLLLKPQKRNSLLEVTRWVEGFSFLRKCEFLIIHRGLVDPVWACSGRALRRLWLWYEKIKNFPPKNKKLKITNYFTATQLFFYLSASGTSLISFQALNEPKH